MHSKRRNKEQKRAEAQKKLCSCKNGKQNMLSAKNDIAAEIWCIELWLSFITPIFAKRKGASNHFRVYFTILQKKKQQNFYS